VWFTYWGLASVETNLMDKRRRYKNPPIEEALCEFHFEPGQEWDATIPGKLHAEIQESYPGKPREQKVVEAAFQRQPDEPFNLRFREGLSKVQLVTADEMRMVAVGPDVLSIHMLRPYQDPQAPEKSGWEEFRPRITEALDAYWRVAEPVGVRRIGVRYVNKITISQENVSVDQYFKFGPPDVKGLPDQMAGFVNHVEYRYDDDVRLILSHATVDAPAGHLAFILDIDVIWQTAQSVDREDALATVEDMRTRECSVFEALITDESRKLFDGD